MDEVVVQVKEIINRECSKEAVPSWFYDQHLLVVEKYAKWLLAYFPQADRKAVMLAVWLHDAQRIYIMEGDHAEAGAKKAEEILLSLGELDESTIDIVVDAIRRHRCNNSSMMPGSIEAKILATADAMAHFNVEFYINIALMGEKSLEKYLSWATEKLERDFCLKIQFPFAKDQIRENYWVIKKFLQLRNQ